MVPATYRSSEVRRVQVLWSSGVQVPPFFWQRDCVLYEPLLQLPLLQTWLALQAA